MNCSCDFAPKAVPARKATARPTTCSCRSCASTDPTTRSSRRSRRTIRHASTRHACWIVDPLDGTREYGEAGRTDWAVHVALVENHTPTASAVALPAQGLVLGTDPAPALAPPTDGPIRILVSRTRPPELATRLAELLDAELVPMGSAGAKATAVLLGAGDVYAHGGGQYEWDSAAPVGVAQAAGCHTSRLDGAPLRYNQPDPYLPDLLVCRPELAERVLAAIAQSSV